MYDIARLEPELLEKSAPATTAPPPAPYTLEHLIAWMEKKNPNAQYDWQSHSVCLLGQYQSDVGQTAAEGWSPYTYALSNFGAPLVSNIGTIHSKLSQAAANIARLEPWTIGAALQRAKELQASWQG